MAMTDGQSSLTLHASALWNTQQSFIQYMEDTGRRAVATDVAARFTPVGKTDVHRLPIDSLVHDAELMRAAVPDPHLAMQMVLRNKATLLPLFVALRAWNRSLGLSEDEAPVPLFIFIQLCTHYWSLNNQIGQFDVVRSKGFIEVTLTPADEQRFHPLIAEGVATGLILAVKDFIHQMPCQVEFPHQHPDGFNHEEFSQAVGTVPSFGQSKILIKYPDEEYDFQINDPVIDILGHLNCLHSQQFPDVSLVQRTRWIMEQLLPMTEPTKHLVARVMNVSVSTLERRLKSADTSFKAVLVHLKKQLAFEYLVRMNKSASKTSMLLGYTSSAQFFKAFKQWFGQTPNEYKASLG